jgi:hypothetical protein
VYGNGAVVPTAAVWDGASAMQAALACMPAVCVSSTALRIAPCHVRGTDMCQAASVVGTMLTGDSASLLSEFQRSGPGSGCCPCVLSTERRAPWVYSMQLLLAAVAMLIARVL